MKKYIGILLILTLLLTVSCQRKGRIIPEKKLSKIYAEMFIADQWLIQNRDEKKRADTLWFYRPIFEKYGYTMEDYLVSVDHYLGDPDKFFKILDKTKEQILKEKTVIEKERDRETAMEANLRKIRAFNFGVKIFSETLDPAYAVDTITIHRDTCGMYVLDPVRRDTIWVGPALAEPADSLKEE